jgi:CheY-like chemotaxis protein
MKILILEDNPARHKIFKQAFFNHTLCIVETSKDAIEALKKEDFEAIFLDHDLGGQQMVESGPNTGYEVAKWLEENPEHSCNNIIIHSLNPVGRDKMKAAIPYARIEPFNVIFPREYNEYKREANQDNSSTPQNT